MLQQLYVYAMIFNSDFYEILASSSQFFKFRQRLLISMKIVVCGVQFLFNNNNIVRNQSRRHSH